MQVDRRFQELERELAEFRPRARPGFRRQLKQDLLSRMGPQNKQEEAPIRSRSNGWLRWAALAVVASTILLLLTPAGRALAQQLLQLGIFRITNDPGAAEQAIQNPDLVLSGQSIESLAVARDQASQAAGFPVYLPEYIPTGYQSVDGPPILLTLNGEGEITAAHWMLAEVKSGDFLHFSQHPFPPDAELSPRGLGVGATGAEALMVGSHDGLWMSNHIWGSTLDELGTPIPVTYNVLIWVQQEPEGRSNYFWLGSQAKLDKAEMLRIAQSLSEG